MSDEKDSVTKKKASARGLGRGLSALMADISTPEAGETTSETAASPKAVDKNQDASDGPLRNVQFISIARLTRNPDQPRKYFDKNQLQELTDSIRLKGVLQPILVRPLPDSQRSQTAGEADFQIVAGERRWQASLNAGLDSMPVLIRDLSDREVLEIGVVENVQRANLTPMEEARAYSALMNEFGRTQADVAEAVGKSRPHISNLLKFLDLPIQTQRYLELGRLSTGHGKALANVPDPDALAEYIIQEGLSVRATEQLAKEMREGIAFKAAKPKTYKDPDIIKLEAELTDALGLAVDLRHKGPSGELRIKYKTAAQLEDLLRRLRD